MLIHDHTLVLQVPRTLFLFIYQRKLHQKKIGFEKISKLRPWPIFGRLQDEQNCSVGRPSGRPTCTKMQACTSVDRAIDHLQEHCSLLGLVDRTVDRQRVSLSGWDLSRLLSPTVEIRPLAIENLTVRPAEGFSTELFPNGQFLFCLFWVLSQRLYCVFQLYFHPL